MPADTGSFAERGWRMKQKLLALLRVVVSVGILFYLFNGIFHDEARKAVPDLDALDWMSRAPRLDERPVFFPPPTSSRRAIQR